MAEPIIYEYSSPGRVGAALPEAEVPPAPLADLLPSEFVRTDLPLPEVGELDVVRHFTRLSQQNVCIDTTFYPLGSCTMKYNPKINEDAARLAGFAQIHPYQPESTLQGALQLIFELQEYLAEVSGMAGVTLQPAAGAHGNSPESCWRAPGMSRRVIRGKPSSFPTRPTEPILRRRQAAGIRSSISNRTSRAESMWPRWRKS